MIGKIIAGSSFAGTVGYVMKELSRILDAEGVNPPEVKNIIEDFKDQTRLNPRLKNTVGHISLSFSPKEAPHMTDALMTQIAKEYMQKMGITDTQYLLVRHLDQPHPHCHLVYNRVGNKGQTISDKNIKIRNTKVCRELTEKYGLHLAPGKDSVRRERLREPDKTKYEIYDAIKGCLPKCKSWNDLEGRLKNVGYFPISINGTAIEKRYGLRVVGTNDTINGLEYFSLKDDTYGLLAWGWYALTDFTKAIPVSDTSSQFRLRKHNIQVGEADMLTTYFPRNETRGNKYFYGEIHIANQKIKLNSARDGLAPTPEAECLKCLIRNFFDGLVKLYHLANDTKKAVERYIDAYKIIQAPATENIVNAQKQLTDACKKLKSITKSKNATNPVAQKVLESYKRRIKDLHTEMDQEIPCIPASELPISSPIPQVEPELDDFEILNNHYPEDLAALIRRVCMSYQRNCPVSHIKLIRELQRKAIRELIEE